MAAPDLGTAIAQCYSHMAAKWAANTLPVNMVSFNTAIIAIFPDDGTAAERTVGNWVVIGKALEAEPLSPIAPFMSQLQLGEAQDYVFKLLSAAVFAQAFLRISVAQGNAILAAYNANLD